MSFPQPARAALSTKPPRPLLYRPSALAIGSSTGGPQALLQLLSALTLRQSLPIFITQHMPATFTSVFAEQIHRQTGWPCKEAADGEIIAGGHCYLAPGDFHMLLRGGVGGGGRLSLEKTPPENFCRPAVDPMLRSLTTVYGRSLLVLILTGMGQDGLAGCREASQKGAAILAQDEATSTVWGMPGVVVKAGLAYNALPLPAIAPYLNENFARLGVV